METKSAYGVRITFATIILCMMLQEMAKGVLVNIGGLGGYILCHTHINNYIHYTVWDVITFLPYPAVPDDGSTVQGVVPYGTIGMPKNLYNNDGDS